MFFPRFCGVWVLFICRFGGCQKQSGCLAAMLRDVRLLCVCVCVVVCLLRTCLWLYKGKPKGRPEICGVLSIRSGQNYWKSLVNCCGTPQYINQKPRSSPHVLVFLGKQSKFDHGALTQTLLHFFGEDKQGCAFKLTYVAKVCAVMSLKDDTPFQ